MEMLVLLLVDRVVRVTGLLIWQVTWEPGEKLRQRGSALSITTFLIIPTLQTKEQLMVISCRSSGCCGLNCNPYCAIAPLGIW